ncbi:alpha-aspartyl dipeptidase isoform X2 [Anthonomus grandis grandis]|uniref:alpha-aspartyl dipeptidase isoform X2 n=1 Tax=Anthonomus grandis grandis TaxID=2921223 RepID=UPI00216618A3|nr:alpha-aspartyl dipeptidase isoform X2 [Anthonomus grandis grandis]
MGSGFNKAKHHTGKQNRNRNKVDTVLFIPYALKDHEAYLKKMAVPFTKWGYTLEGIHNCEDPVQAVNNAKTIYIGGGNTFRLLKALYDLKLIEPIRKRVLEQGIPYIGSSAGTNVATVSISTTNDMPICYPPTLKALNLVPFNINPHYQDPEPESKHKGETREERILQYLEEEDSYTVLGLREGTMLSVKGYNAVLRGIKSSGARLFVKNQQPEEIEIGADLSRLLKGDKNGESCKCLQ